MRARTTTTDTGASKQAQAWHRWEQLRHRKALLVRTGELARKDRIELLRSSLILEIQKGWYMVCPPENGPSFEQTWHEAFWPFCGQYLNDRFGRDWCLSADNSLLLHAGNWGVPALTSVCARGANNRMVRLPFGTSLFNCNQSLPGRQDIEIRNGLHLFRLEAAFVHASPAFYSSNPDDAKVVLEQLRDRKPDMNCLTSGNNLSSVGRLIGALLSIGAEETAQDIHAAMKNAGHTVRARNPFAHTSPG